MKSRTYSVLLAACVGPVLACVGCEPKIDVFDKPAIDEVRTVLVVPPAAGQEPTAGPIVAGALSERLRTARYKKLEVLVPPALWRLRYDSGRPAADLVSRQDALRIAQQAGADAVLTGTVNYSIDLIFPPGLPKAIRDMKASEFKNKFAIRVATAWVKLALVAVKDNRDLYVNTGQAKGMEDSDLMTKAVEAAIKPLEEHLGARKDK